MMSTPPSQEIMVNLTIAYAMELAAKQSYIAASINLDGVQSEVIKKALTADITEELNSSSDLIRPDHENRRYGPR
ncbi:MAG: hypothetical protein VXX36_04810 [Verrucomicrobiota bacterium]|nr:hypothetical protein [Verrucomicrobiota bacterium]